MLTLTSTAFIMLGQGVAANRFTAEQLTLGLFSFPTDLSVMSPDQSYHDYLTRHRRDSIKTPS